MLGSPLRLPKLHHSTKQFLTPLSPEERASFLLPVSLTPLQSVTFKCPPDLLPSPKRQRLYKSPQRVGHMLPKSLSPSHVSSHNQFTHDDITRSRIRRRIEAIGKKVAKEEKRYSPLSSFPLQKKLRRKQCKPYDLDWISPRRSLLNDTQVATVNLGSHQQICSPYCSPLKVSQPVSKLPVPLPLYRPVVMRPQMKSRGSPDEEDTESVSSWVVQSPKYL
jgi:hypothetical protein